MTDEDLTALFEKVHSDYFSKNSKKIKARFYPYRSLRHTIEWNYKLIDLKISRYLSDAPVNILEDLAVLLLAKIYKITPDKAIKESYCKYAKSINKELPKRKKSVPKGYYSQGNYYNLQEIFDNLNDIYFSNKLSVKHLGWSKNKSYTRLGYYDREKDLLVVSQIFDSHKVPENVVEYMVYHEMLHILIPTTTNNGRRKIHTSKFRQLEREFPDYLKIQNWLNKKRHKL
jgi:predicted metal-dependent hydrolase